MKDCVQCGLRREIMPRSRKCAQCMTSNEVAYKARRRAANVGILVVREVWKDANGKCEYCAVAVHPKRDKYDHRQTIGEIDHVLPVIMGGKGERENLKLACKKCNRSRDADHRKVYLGVTCG